MNQMKHNDYHFEYQEELVQQDLNVISDGLAEEDILRKGMEPARPFGIFIKKPNEMAIGGINGFFSYGCLYLEMLWVKPEWRRQGLGKKLVIESEKIGREKKCTFATLNTMDWEALSFYQKLGYEIEFVREGFEKESKMYMLRKQL
jgi:ribosomal protein S18 acetylase RimI-like enzyme